jgi:hypothetical protein
MPKTTSFTMSDEMAEKIESFLSGTKSISQFAFDATEEKIKRLEKRSREAKELLHLKNKELLKPIIQEILEEMGK